ncbi:MAG: hydrogenase maturation nickel metallochaperone HypA [Bryobacterales bacterium]|nr:hydrogenase maturation nickel metallochaperone HypA [Bryobacterales bacterium]
MALSILELAEDEARQRGATAIRAIAVRLGEMSGVVRDALEFSFEVARNGTLAGAASLEIEVVPLATRCPACGDVPNTLHDLCLLCPDCGGRVEIAAGRELEIRYVDLEC